MPKPDDFAGFEEAEVSSQIAEKVANSVFKAEFKHLQRRLDRQESTSIAIMLGSVVAMFLITAGLIWDSRAFMGEYNQRYLDSETRYLEEVSEFKNEQYEMQFRMSELQKTLTEIQNQKKVLNAQL